MASEQRDKQQTDTTNEALRQQIGQELLGPVIQRWLLALHQHVEYFRDADTAFLYCARAGVRIERLYRAFLQGYAGRDNPAGDLFWISRIAVAKGVSQRKPALAHALLAREYWHLPLRDLVTGLLRHQPERLRAMDLDAEELNAHGHNFPGWITVKGPVQREVVDYLQRCGDAFDGYVTDLLQARKRAILIDSGWQGSTQSLLHHAYPDREWYGLYFGRILTAHHDPSIVPDVVGLMFESQGYDPAVPESAFAVHRHIIEVLLEPNGPSIEEIPFGFSLDTAMRLVEQNKDEDLDAEDDWMYLAVMRYLDENTGLSISEIMRRHQQAMPELARLILHPSRQEAIAFYAKPRSADFGKSLKVPVLIQPAANAEEGPDEQGSQQGDDAESRIERSLWPQGQIALEYEGGVARDLQMRVSGLTTDAAYFDPTGTAQADALQAVPELPDFERPVVAIVTRTKNRPVLLKRAAESVARQTFGDYVWVIVNDGGDAEPVRQVIAACPIDRRRIVFVSNRVSLGMEAASNVGIRASGSEFIVIHDDDDSWDPGFLAKTVSFLRGSRGRRYGGVITQSTYVSEEIRGDKVIEHGRWPYQDWVRNVQIAEMACGNFFPPIAFVYRRELYDAVGGYNEALPVLGDWFFNLEFLLQADIGVIVEPLAFYHHRDTGGSRTGLYANSVIGGVSKHEEFAAIARNEFLRRHGNNNAAASVVLGHAMGDIRSRFDRMPERIREGGMAPSGDSGGGWPGRSGSKAGADMDAIDRYWVAAEINRIVASRQGGLFGGSKVKPVSPDSSWEDILRALRALRERIATQPNFDESRYLSENPDVADGVDRNTVLCAYAHYVMFGRAEGRRRPGK
jgi:glycosyltransferase involved in cell wall biosynthesis